MAKIARTWKATIAALLPAAAAAGLACAEVRVYDPLPALVASIGAQLDPRVAQTLGQLDGTGRQLLALRSYLRFELYVNAEVRSLDVQIEHWNSNTSVTAAAEEILAAAQALMAAPEFPGSRSEQARMALEAFLSAYRPVPTPTIAAPGLSLHGQMRAIDFQVHQGGRVVAGPSTAAVRD